MTESHRPVCVTCKIEMRPEKNDVLVVDYRITHVTKGKDALFEHQEQYQCWSADLWKCPKCQKEIVIKFGGKSLAHGEEGIKNWIEDYKEISRVVNNYEYRR